MSQNTSSDGAGVPLLEELSGSNGGKAEEKWWNKVVDVEEAKNQTCFAFPMILTNFFHFFITLVSVMFAGHLGQLELAGATLANSWCTVSGIAFLAGLSGALETLCGQAFGANLHRMLGVYLQASCIISIVLSVITSVIWLYTEPILVLLRQDPEIAKASALYLKYLIPGLFAYGLLQNLLRFLQTQSVVMPLIALSAIPTALHIGIVYVMVNWTGLGFKGAPLAASISLWISAIVLLTYVLRSKKFKNTWDGFSFESFSYILPCLKLALPSAAMVCLEYWAFELLVLLGGMMPDAELTTSLTAMCLNTEAIAFMCAFGFSAAVSTRVSNELGAGNPDKAKHAMVINLELAFVLALIITLTLVFGHNIWSILFSDSATIIKAFASMTPFLAMSFTVDTFQAVLSGVTRGCGWQHLAVIANLTTFYFIGMPIAVLLGFKFKFYVKGLWVGLICGLFSNCCALLLISLRTKWIKVDLANSGDNGSLDLA